MCCGQKRAELRNNSAIPVQGSTSPATTSHQPTKVVSSPIVELRALGRTSISARVTSPNQSIHQQPPTMNRSVPVASPFAPMTIRYLESSRICVRGPVTGQQYEFSGVRPVQSIDARDAASLLQSRFFRRA
jgi:hypothetical protein